jgi:hypothetical protein
MTDQPLHLDTEWEERAALRDGSEVHVRLLRPEDKAASARRVRAAVAGVALPALLQPQDPAHQQGAGLPHRARPEHATWPSAPAASARTARRRASASPASCACRSARTCAEAAIAVVDDAGQGHRGPAVRAPGRGRPRARVERFRCEVLGDNEPMQRFLHELDPDAELHYEDGVAVIELELPEIEATHPAAEPPREHPDVRSAPAHRPRPRWRCHPASRSGRS